MSDVSPIVIVSVAIGTILALYFVNKTNYANINDSFEDLSANFANQIAGSLTKNTKPILWFVVDDYGTNNRKWNDFGARSSRNLNLGFLAITKSKCVLTQGKDFDIRTCLGRAEVANIIIEHGGHVPDYHLTCYPRLWKAWARAALLYHVGGLYFDGFSLCLGPSFLSDINGKSDAVFGVDHDEPRTSALNGSCSQFVGWASGPKHKPWESLLSEITNVINTGADTWTATIARNQLAVWYNTYLRDEIHTIRHSEWSRKADGRPIEIEDLFGRSYNNLSTDWKPPEHVVYVPLDYETIDRSVTYKWFLKLSAQDILSDDSTFLWAHLSKNIRGQN